MPVTPRQRQAYWLRIARKWHRTTGIALFVLFAAVGITGLLLGWKKNSGGYLLPASQTGTVPDSARAWLPIAVLQDSAVAYFRRHISATAPANLERIDIRPDKGMVKFVFHHSYRGLQLDCATGAVLAVEHRRSDLIEDLHDGSFFDAVLGTKGEWIKLLYTTVMGLALLLFTTTGFWLWYGPKRMRRREKKLR